MKNQENILRVALYPRVSTEEQFLRGYSLQTQEEVLTQYAADHNYKIVGIYRDEGHSARKPAMKRKVMQELLADVQAGKIDRILFIKLDRWFRNVREYHKIQEILENNNVTWQATLEDYSTATADGRLKVNIMLSVAENESDRTSERIKFVFDGKRRRKEWCFTGPCWPYGYRPEMIDGVKRCVKDPETEPIVQDFWDYVTNYRSIRKAGMYCCEKYGITKNYRSWMSMARNEYYTGTFYGVENYCEPYVSREVWEQIAVDHQVIKKTQRPDRVYLFTGMIRCPVCGNTLKATFKTYPNDRTKEYYGYRCNNGRIKLCDYRHQVSERTVEKYLLANVRKSLEDSVLQAEAQQKNAAAKPQVHDIVAKQEQLRRLNVIFMSGNISDEEYTSEVSRLKAEIERIRSQTETRDNDNLDMLKKVLEQDVLDAYSELSKEDKRRFWRSILEEIYVDGCKVTGMKIKVS